MGANTYFIVDKRILPDYFEKVVKTRKLLDSGAVKEVSAAVRMTGISRSTYYKYKDFIFEPDETASGRKAVFLLLLSHETGVLSSVLSAISSLGANILTITQSPPINEKASVTLSADIGNIVCDAGEIALKLLSIQGVE
ncbi:MAG: ACT domain-containing protein, partial [Clostridia bacterium]|nr:ACT domain-containing protein [Clostridia bacterium]